MWRKIGSALLMLVGVVLFWKGSEIAITTYNQISHDKTVTALNFVDRLHSSQFPLGIGLLALSIGLLVVGVKIWERKSSNYEA